MQSFFMTILHSEGGNVANSPISRVTEHVPLGPARCAFNCFVDGYFGPKLRRHVGIPCHPLRVAWLVNETVHLLGGRAGNGKTPLPFVLSFSLPSVIGKEASFSIQERFEGADVRTVSKAIRALSVLRSGGTVELYALEAEKSLATLNATASVPETEQRDGWENVILAAARISETFNVDLLVPKRVSDDDLQALTLLMAIAEGEELPIRQRQSAQEQ